MANEESELKTRDTPRPDKLVITAEGCALAQSFFSANRLGWGPANPWAEKNGKGWEGGAVLGVAAIAAEGIAAARSFSLHASYRGSRNQRR